MRVRLHDIVAMAAILSGGLAGLAIHRLRSEGPVDRSKVQAPSIPTSIRVKDVGPGVRGVVSRDGAPDVAVPPGTEIAIDGRDFEATFHIPHHLGPVTMSVEFLHDGAVVGEARISALRPKVFVSQGRFGVRGL